MRLGVGVVGPRPGQRARRAQPADRAPSRPANCIRPRCRFAHSWYSLASTAPPCSLSAPDAMTRSAMSSSEKPERLLQDRHTEFSNARCWPQLGQMKSRTKHSPLERRHVDGHVDHAALGVGVDDAAQRRHVGVVAARNRPRCSARRPSGRWSGSKPSHWFCGVHTDAHAWVASIPTMRSFPGGGSVAR